MAVARRKVSRTNQDDIENRIGRSTPQTYDSGACGNG